VQPAISSARKKCQPNTQEGSPAGCQRGHRSVAGEQRKSAVQQENHAAMKAGAPAMARARLGTAEGYKARGRHRRGKAAAPLDFQRPASNAQPSEALRGIRFFRWASGVGRWAFDVGPRSDSFRHYCGFGFLIRRACPITACRRAETAPSDPRHRGLPRGRIFPTARDSCPRSATRSPATPRVRR